MKQFHSQEGEEALKGIEDNKGKEKGTYPGTLPPVPSHLWEPERLWGKYSGWGDLVVKVSSLFWLCGSFLYFLILATISLLASLLAIGLIIFSLFRNGKVLLRCLHLRRYFQARSPKHNRCIFHLRAQVA